jgi:hypothetical protein
MPVTYRYMTPSISDITPIGLIEHGIKLTEAAYPKSLRTLAASAQNRAQASLFVFRFERRLRRNLRWLNDLLELRQ